MPSTLQSLAEYLNMKKNSKNSSRYKCRAVHFTGDCGLKSANIPDRQRQHINRKVRDTILRTRDDEIFRQRHADNLKALNKKEHHKVSKKEEELVRLLKNKEWRERREREREALGNPTEKEDRLSCGEDRYSQQIGDANPASAKGQPNHTVTDHEDDLLSDAVARLELKSSAVKS